MSVRATQQQAAHVLDGQGSAAGWVFARGGAVDDESVPATISSAPVRLGAAARTAPAIYRFAVLLHVVDDGLKVFCS